MVSHKIFEDKTAEDPTSVVEEAKAYSGIVESRTSLRLLSYLAVYRATHYSSPTRTIILSLRFPNNVKIKSYLSATISVL
jgi:hypothetical protein